jgi:hypothetical protein
MRGRGGVIENLWFENIRMDSITREAIQINMHYGSSSIAPRSQEPPVFRNFHFKNITSSYAEYAVRMRGLEEQYVDNMSFSGIDINSKHGIVVENVKNCSFDSLKIQSGEGPIDITNAENLWFKNTRYDAPVDTMVRLKGRCEQLHFTNTNSSDYISAFSSKGSSGDGLIVFD